MNKILAFALIGIALVTPRISTSYGDSAQEKPTPSVSIQKSSEESAQNPTRANSEPKRREVEGRNAIQTALEAASEQPPNMMILEALID